MTTIQTQEQRGERRFGLTRNRILTVASLILFIGFLI